MAEEDWGNFWELKKKGGVGGKHTWNETFFWTLSSPAIPSVSLGIKAIFPIGREEKTQMEKNAVYCGQESRSLSIATNSMNIH